MMSCCVLLPLKEEGGDELRAGYVGAQKQHEQASGHTRPLDGF
jgi:hypothetical protein